MKPQTPQMESRVSLSIPAPSPWKVEKPSASGHWHCRDRNSRILGSFAGSVNSHLGEAERLAPPEELTMQLICGK